MIQVRTGSANSRELRRARIALPLQGRELVPVAEVGAVGPHGEIRCAPSTSIRNHGHTPRSPCTICPREGALRLVPADLHVVPVVARVGLLVAATDAGGEGRRDRLLITYIIYWCR